MRNNIVIILLDGSGSMGSKEEITYNATVDLLKTLAKENEDSTDFEFKVLLLIFNTEIVSVPTNAVPLPPEQALELFERSVYKCGGGTSLAAVFNKLDALFSRKEGGMLNQASKGDAYPLVVFISDYVPTDSEKAYEEAKNRLLSNQFYQKTNRLCIYVGSESRRSVAAEMVGGEDNVLAIDMNLKGLLSPVIIGSSILLTNATHIGNADKTPAEIAEEQKERAEEGEYAAEKLKDDQLKEEMKKLFGLA